MINAKKITKDGKEFRVIVGDVFSANNDFRAMLTIEANSKKDWNTFENAKGSVVECYVLGKTIDIEIDYGEAVEGSDSYLVVYVGNDTV